MPPPGQTDGKRRQGRASSSAPSATPVEAAPSNRPRPGEQAKRHILMLQIDLATAKVTIRAPTHGREAVHAVVPRRLCNGFVRHAGVARAQSSRRADCLLNQRLVCLFDLFVCNSATTARRD